MTLLPKKQMSEEDIKLQFFTPAITSSGISKRLPWKLLSPTEKSI